MKEGFKMKFRVNENCIGCGLCEATCPNVFHLTEEGYAVAISEDVHEEDIDLAMQALENCPVEAIVKE